MKRVQELAFIYVAFFISLLLLVFVFIQSRGIEGGLDSWNHFLISKCALKHPELFLDQWNKPVFTVFTVLVCQFGINALIGFNIACVSLSGLILALAFRNSGYKYTWILVPFTVFTPVLFYNTISGLTEPLNVLFLSIIICLWQLKHLKSAVILASFLPFVRTEGFVIVAALMLLIILKKEYKLLFYLISGSIFMNLLGFAISGKPFWIITENPYWKHEISGTFEAGSGSLFHYIIEARAIFGFPLLLLFATACFSLIYCFFKKIPFNSTVVLSFWIFIFYFTAHSSIYYLGILGSQGLTRVMAVIAPALAVLAFYALYHLTLNYGNMTRSTIFFLAAFAVVWTAYSEADYAKPHRINEISVKSDKTQKNFIKAGEWLISNKLMSRPIINQSPFFDVYFDKDPYDLNSSYRVWSIDQKKDWAATGVIVLWDGFSAVREGNMKLDWLLGNPQYKLLHTIEGFEIPENDSNMYKICIFEKIASPLDSK